jgi:hypothetical protein
MLGREKRGFMAALGQTLVVAVGLLAAAASANQGQNREPVQPPGPTSEAPPPSQSMDPAMALGLWKSNFGAVKIDRDLGQGPDYVMGVWVYNRQGEEVIGFFDGTLEGNVLQFTWHEPSRPQDLTGAGYLVFERDGSAFSGRWWSDARDRDGAWNGWRAEDAPAPAAAPAAPAASPPPEGPAEQAGPPPEDDVL